MELLEQCEQLQIILKRIVEIVDELSGQVSKLPNCSISESPALVRAITNLCGEGSNLYQKSQSYTELIQASFGSKGVGTAVEKSKTENIVNAAEKNLKGGIAVAQIAVVLAGGLLGSVADDSTRSTISGELFGLTGASDLISEAGMSASPANKENIKRRDEEIEKAAKADNEPKTFAPPDP